MDREEALTKLTKMLADAYDACIKAGFDADTTFKLMGSLLDKQKRVSPEDNIVSTYLYRQKIKRER